MGPLIGFSCPDCGTATYETLMAGNGGHCARCALRFRLEAAKRRQQPGMNYCAPCDRWFTRGQWEKHVFSRMHKMTVRLHLKPEVRHA